MTKRLEYRAVLTDLTDWEPFLLANSGLPGPRGNLELAQAVADVGGEEQFRRWLTLGPDRAPVNSPEEFLAFCGILGLGASLSRDCSGLTVLRPFAADPRWRAREAVAMALQRWGEADMAALLGAMVEWSSGSPWEQRAAAAALCEPRLLVNPVHAAAALGILDAITASVGRVRDRRDVAFKVLRQGLGYCWSVAVVACPAEGKPMMEKWLNDPDSDIRWIMRENLRKNRMARMDPGWTAACLASSD